MRPEATLLVLWLALGCKGSDTEINQLVPEITVAPSSIDFGDAAVPDSGTVDLYVSNAGRVPLEVELAFAEGDPAVFSVAEPTFEVPADDTVVVPVTFSPATYLTYGGTLTVSSNDAETPEIEVALLGNGVYQPMPDIAVDPLALDFGVVASGSESLKYLNIVNEGDAPLTLGKVVQTGSGSFELLTDPSDAVIAGGGALPVVVRYLPVVGTGDSGQLRIPSDDPDEGSVQVLFVGNGGGGEDYPVAEIDCPGEVDPPLWVTLDGAGSHDPGGLEPLAYAWKLVDRPDGSQAELSSATDTETSMFVDAAGEYDVTLVVTNTAGLKSTPARCTIDAVPTEELHVELTWTGSRSDLDLHLRQDGSEPFERDGDCTWCNPTTGWGASLDLDDRSGLGPENINVPTPASGKYRIAVHYFEANGDDAVEATVRVYTYGVLAEEITRTIDYNELWEVGVVNWPEGTVGVIDTVATAPTKECF